MLPPSHTHIHTQIFISLLSIKNEQIPTITLRNAGESIDRKTLSILYLQIQTFRVLTVRDQTHYS